MNILMIAPEPYFRPRGTPFSIADRLKGLTALGFTVHLVTYPFGEDIPMPGVKIDRIPHIPFIKNVKIGPSLAKIPLDVMLFFKTMWILATNKSYCAIHTHEEGALIGVIARLLFRLPHLYDMHSSLYQQMSNFEFTKNPVVLKFVGFCEKLFLKNSESVIVICPSLKDRVMDVAGNREGVFLIENLPLWKDFENDAQTILKRKKELNMAGKTIIFYAGTFEPYQGLDLVLESASIIAEKYKDFVFLIIGGTPDQKQDYQQQITARKLDEYFYLTGQIPPGEIPTYAEISDILISPRKTGTNTPLKIYSYLKSGKPILATRLYTHTQVLDDNVACLVDPNPQSFTDGLIHLMENPQTAAKLGEAAKKLAEQEYTFEQYIRKLDKAYRHMRVNPPGNP